VFKTMVEKTGVGGSTPFLATKSTSYRASPKSTQFSVSHDSGASAPDDWVQVAVAGKEYRHLIECLQPTEPSPGRRLALDYEEWWGDRINTHESYCAMKMIVSRLRLAFEGTIAIHQVWRRDVLAQDRIRDHLTYSYARDSRFVQKQLSTRDFVNET